ncbi:flagellar export chaperone FlgN [Janthinobacterium sp.]|uniref:flagellar export chaperone FlgN n=1 Tax=Janthinobacterium sp. TaxID=1871054 RepID=UPI00293D32D2|nr:flagellar export chaperone FlgN [Janthinobacterium sp.]
MTRQEALARLLADVAEDVAAYRALTLLLEAQFEAALRHRSAALAQLADEVGAMVDTLDTRRRQRVVLVGALLGPAGTMAQAAELLKGASRRQLDANWAELERMVRECKRLNQRNSDFLTDQYTIMQRVLQGEDQIYAPA